MKTVLIILVFFFGLVALLELYTNETFSQGNPNQISIGGIDVSNMDPNTQIPCAAWPVGTIKERACLDPNSNQQIGTIPFGRVGDFIYPSEYTGSANTVFAGTPLQIAVGIAVAFVALGFIAGLFGAGQLANVVAVAGIGLAVYYYINSILASQFESLPVTVVALINGIVGVFFIYLFIKLIRG